MSLEYIPPDKDELERDYEIRSPAYKELLTELVFCFEKVLKEKNIRYSAINKRVKKFNSFYDKICKKKIEENFFERIEDIAGLRIICLYRSDLKNIEKIIKENVHVIKEELIRNKDELIFGYMSDNYITKLPPNYMGPRYDEIKDLKCEIQVRSISMHAWATVSHHLAYKQEIDVPKELRKDFNALSGVFYVADTLFEQFRVAREVAIDNMLKDIEEVKFDLNREINFDTLNAYLLMTYPERTFLNDESYNYQLSVLLNEISYTEISALYELDVLRIKYWESIIEEDKKRAPEIGREFFYSAISMVRSNLYNEYPELETEALKREQLFNEPDYEPYYEEPDYEEPDHEEPHYEEPDYEEPDHEEPHYEEPDYEEPDHESK